MAMPPPPHPYLYHCFQPPCPCLNPATCSLPALQLAQFHTQFNPEAEYRKIQAARHRVAQITANVRAQLAQVEAGA